MNSRPSSMVIGVLLMVGAVFVAPVQAQCILANPSFEILDAGAPIFSGWNQFGVVGSTSPLVHGEHAAKVTGPNSGGWNVSAFWQSHDAVPGEQFDITGHFLIPSLAPLAGGSLAIVNVEWHDAGGMIDYQSFDIADAGTPTDEEYEFSFTSSPAPAGTIRIHLLVGVLQEPGTAQPTVIYDRVHSTSPVRTMGSR